MSVKGHEAHQRRPLVVISLLKEERLADGRPRSRVGFSALL
jgi:hypothetical protein